MENNLERAMFGSLENVRKRKGRKMKIKFGIDEFIYYIIIFITFDFLWYFYIEI